MKTLVFFTCLISFFICGNCAPVDSSSIDQLEAIRSNLVSLEDQLKELEADLGDRVAQDEEDIESELPGPDQQSAAQTQQRQLKQDIDALKNPENPLPVKDKQLIDVPQREFKQDVDALQNFESELPVKDKQLIDNMQSKIHYLQTALEHEADSPKENVEEESEEDENEQLLKTMQTKIRQLQTALLLPESHAGPPTNYDSSRDQVMGPVVSENGQKKETLAEFVSHLSPEDASLLDKVKSKLHYLEEALHHPGKPVEEEEQENPQNATQRKVAYGKGEMQEFVLRNPLNSNADKTSDYWRSRALPSEELGIQEVRCECESRTADGRCDCEKQPTKSENTIRCACDDKTITPDKRCECDKAESSDVNEVELRLLKDIAYAKGKGLSIKDIIKAIEAKRRAALVAREEEELGAALERP